MSLAKQTGIRLRLAGIGPGDRGLGLLRGWNVEVYRKAGLPDPHGQLSPAEGADMAMTTCTREGCGAQIEWALMDSGAKMPVDYHSAGDPGGTLAVTRGPDGQLRARMLTRAHPDLRRGEKRGAAHWVTCQNPPPKANRPACPQCGHKPHTGPCERLGRVECRPLPDGAGSVRGQFPCGCEHVTAEPAP